MGEAYTPRNFLEHSKEGQRQYDLGWFSLLSPLNDRRPLFPLQAQEEVFCDRLLQQPGAPPHHGPIHRRCGICEVLETKPSPGGPALGLRSRGGAVIFPVVTTGAGPWPTCVDMGVSGLGPFQEWPSGEGVGRPPHPTALQAENLDSGKGNCPEDQSMLRMERHLGALMDLP